jgi:hypothetical protein
VDSSKPMMEIEPTYFQIGIFADMMIGIQKVWEKEEFVSKMQQLSCSNTNSPYRNVCGPALTMLKLKLIY